MCPQLTAGAINRILIGEDVENAVVQILGCKRIPGIDNDDRYRLLISDGVTGCPFVMLGTQLNYMVANHDLLQFTIVRVDKYVCNQVQADRKVIILLKITVLAPGNEVNEKLGNPVNSCPSGGATSIAPAVSDVKEVHAKQNAISAHYSSMINGYGSPVLFTQFLYTMFTEVASGAISRILNGEDVENAVLQILGFKKLPGPGNDRYRLLISDGVTSCPFAFLGTQLNYMIANKELEKFAIVRVEKYVFNQVQADCIVILLLNLTVLVPGNQVNEKLGNPVLSSTGAATNANSVTETGCSAVTVAAHESSKTNLSTLSVPFNRLYITFPELTTGAINRILNGEDVANAVLQILGCKKISGAGNDRYRLLISDGVSGCPFVMLSTRLNHMVANKELEKFTIVRVEKCVCNQVQPDRKVIILLSLTVLVPGNEVNEKLGNPVNSSTGAAAAEATTNAPAVNGVAETGCTN